MDDELPPPPQNPEDEPPIPRKLTEGMIRAAVALLTKGHFRTVVAQRMGIGYTTWKRWLALGKRFPDGLYGQLRAKVLQAEAAAEEKMIATILEAGKDDVEHLKWYAERKWPQRYGRYRGELGEIKRRLKQLEQAEDEYGAAADQAAE